ncbi:MAG: cytochrome c [Bacteroidia bacterium]|nr:cytochrome c [Bacteroidia bacterium]MCZ2249962.1 cytochrome c [Bacteroidia bacterium]
MNSYKNKILIFIILLISFLIYTNVLYFTELKPIPAPNKSAQRGKILWQEKNCTSCHQLYGLGGHLGPDLTNIYENKPESYIKVFLKNGTNVMPNFHLSEQEINDFMEFFKYTNSTGIANPTSYIKQADGTIKQK